MNFRRTDRSVPCLLLVSVFLLCRGASNAQSPSGDHPPIDSKSYVVRRATSPIRVDGILNEPAWETTARGDLPFEWLPGDNIPSPVDTEFLITFSEDFLYIGFRCFDPDPSQIRAHLMDRDDTDILIQDDHLSFMIDTFNDERRGFQFRVNPLGVQADANFSELEGYEDFSWDAIWQSSGRINEWGWAVEVAIPFNQLRFPGGEEVQTWGFSAERSYPRNVRHRMTSHKRRRDLNCIICQFNKVAGFQGMKTGLNLEISPTFTAIRTDVREDFPEGGMVDGKIEPDPGLSVRWGATSNLIFNATVNPDFSQVEADVRELEVNTRFAIRYPEKRPFFLEGADFFLTPIEAVFTRTVADPDGGFKFTGKTGKNAFGVFGVYDTINNLLIPSNQGSAGTSLDQNVPGGVFRFRRDVGRGSTVGVLYTGRTGEGYYNHVTGMDGFLRLSRTKTLSVQYLHSETSYPDTVSRDFGQKEERFGGDAFNLNLFHNSRDWTFNLSYLDRSPDFRADFGYVPRVDYRRGVAALNRVFWGDRGGWFNRVSVGLQGSVIYDYQGELTDRELQVNTIYMGPLQSTVYLALQRNQEFYLGNLYDLNQFVGQAEMKPTGGLRFSLMAMGGDTIDYQNARAANLLLMGPFAEVSLGRHVNFNLRHNFQKLSLEEGRIFTANLTQMRFIINFSTRMFVRAIVQYLHLDNNPELFLYEVTPLTETVFTQLLFSYKLNPQTVFFLGYSDNALGMTGLDITRSDRTFFLKLGYAWTR